MREVNGEVNDVNIVVFALVVVHPDGKHLLMVRKAGTTSFMLPGGKPEPGESGTDTIIREIAEELGLVIEHADLEELGTWTAQAANESGFTVTGTVFLHAGVPRGLDVGSPQVAEEIDAAGWFPWDDLPADTDERQFAPLTRDRVIPHLRTRLGELRGGTGDWSACR